jgi:hypothetical protein
VSTISCTSPRASAIGLPTSRVTSWASASRLLSTSRPIWAMTRPRTGGGVAAHAGCAACAARNASTTWSAEDSCTCATTSDRSAGFVEVRVEPVPSTEAPLTKDVTRMRGCSIGRGAGQGEWVSC